MRQQQMSDHNYAFMYYGHLMTLEPYIKPWPNLQFEGLLGVPRSRSCPLMHRGGESTSVPFLRRDQVKAVQWSRHCVLPR